jgi:hypothetical protein
MVPPLIADGSAAADRKPIIEIDRSNDVERYRWTCPEGHVDWAPTNNHLWCSTCRRQYEHGRDVDPEHYHVVDQQTGEEIPWTRVELEGRA